MIYFTTILSPVDELLLVSDGEALTGLFMDKCAHGPPVESNWRRVDSLAVFEETKQQLARYFKGLLTSFDLPLNPTGTAFQKTVWQALLKIPYGQTINYKQLAERIGNPNAQRAVGLANGRNPIGIVVPCHRVIGADGSMTGYGGGVDRKQFLLLLESGTGLNPAAGGLQASGRSWL
jgi:methylated-DNA-[protein]-cysteine S-methyltransferase